MIKVAIKVGLNPGIHQIDYSFTAVRRIVLEQNEFTKSVTVRM